MLSMFTHRATSKAYSTIPALQDAIDLGLNMVDVETNEEMRQIIVFTLNALRE